MMKKIGLILGLSLLGVTACQKAALKKPVEVNFSFDLDDGTENPGTVKINKGEINLSNFNVSGTRVEGEDIEFMRPFENGLLTDMNGSGEVKELDYQIPQGDYTSIILDFSTTVGDAQNPSFFIEGKYQPIAGSPKDIRFEMVSSINYQIDGEAADGLSSIIMDKKLGKKVEIDFDPTVWFETISEDEWDDAEEIGIGSGPDMFLINASNNYDIYTEVSARLHLGVTAIFK
ncbi:MAG: hypothetical protein ABJG99_05910 [Crocinitomicaceae bacterium]